MNQPRDALKDAAAFEEIYGRVLEAAGAETQMDLARRLGIRQSSVSDAKKKKRVPSSWILALCVDGGWNPRWLMSGEPPRRLVVAGADPEADGRDDPDGLKIVPVVSAELKRDKKRGWHGKELGRICIPGSYDCAGLLVVECGDAGLEPYVRRGAYVGIETGRMNVADGDIYGVFLPGAGLVFRRVFLDIGQEALLLRGENKNQPPLSLPLAKKETQLVGRVAWTLQKH